VKKTGTVNERKSLEEAISILEDRLTEERRKRDEAIAAINLLEAQLDAAERGMRRILGEKS